MNPHDRRRIPELRVGCAGWAIAGDHKQKFPQAGSHLQRYGQRFNAVEVNSSFYRNHKPATYRRWASAVPETFRFSVKCPRSITHQAMLENCRELLADFLAGVGELDEKLGCLLLQLPPRLAWDQKVALPFLAELRRLHQGPVACEPRHASWFTTEAGDALTTHHIARVAADPALSLRARLPGGDQHLQYVRLHGSPRMYYESYCNETIDRLAMRLQKPASDTTQRWCIFDNTAEGHAISNALSLQSRLRDG